MVYIFNDLQKIHLLLIVLLNEFRKSETITRCCEAKKLVAKVIKGLTYLLTYLRTTLYVVRQILGLLVTYFLLVVQFGIPFESSTAISDAMTNVTSSESLP